MIPLELYDWPAIPVQRHMNDSDTLGGTVDAARYQRLRERHDDHPFTVAEAAEYLNVGQRYIRWLRETGRIPVLKYGGGPSGRIRVLKRHLDDFMADAEECGVERGRDRAPRTRSRT